MDRTQTIKTSAQTLGLTHTKISFDEILHTAQENDYSLFIVVIRERREQTVGQATPQSVLPIFFIRLSAATTIITMILITWNHWSVWRPLGGAATDSEQEGIQLL